MMRSLLLAAALLAGGACRTLPPETSMPPMSENRADDGLIAQIAATSSFRRGQPVALRPLRDGVLFLRSGARSPERDLYRFDPATGTSEVVLTAADVLQGAQEQLTEEEQALRERLRLSATGITSYQLGRDEDVALVPLSGRLFMVTLATKAVRELVSDNGPAITAVLSPDAQRVAVVRGDNVYVIDVESGAERQLTQAEGDHVRWGLAEFVAQEEMSRTRGLWWSPDSKRLLIQRTDTSAVERFHLADLAHPEQVPSPRPYPRPGAANAEVQLALFDVDGGDPVDVPWATERWHYLAQVVWKKGAPLTLRVQDRRQQHQGLLTVDVDAGSTELMYEEHDDTWINLDRSGFRWLRDGQRYLWSTEAGGAWRLELRHVDGTATTLVPESLGYRRVLQVDEKAGVVRFAASSDPLVSHVYEVSLEPGTGEVVQLSEGDGQHGLVRRAGRPWGIATVSDAAGLRAWRVVDADGRVVGELPSVAEDPPSWPQLEFTQAGERDQHVVIVRPQGFEAGRRYPVLVHVYGGPRHPMVVKDARRYVLDQWYADHGFIVVAIDGRGTPNRGRDWERAIHHDVITAPLHDQADALLALGERYDELDLDRVGIFGWSFGGYFSAHAVMQRPEVFRVGVAGAPVADWHDYDTHYTERYMGLPADNADGYAHTSVLTHAEHLTRPLLVVHGTEDDNVWFTHALKMSDALFRAGKPHGFLPLTGYTHMVADPLVLRRRHETVLRFLSDGLRD